MPSGLAKPFNLKKIISPLLSYVTGCFHGIKLSLGKWALLILPNGQSPSGISLNSVDYWVWCRLNGTIASIKKKHEMFSSFHCFYSFLYHGICCIERYFYTDLKINNFHSVSYQVMCPYAPSSNLQNVLLCSRIRSVVPGYIPGSIITNKKVIKSNFVSEPHLFF